MKYKLISMILLIVTTVYVGFRSGSDTDSPIQITREKLDDVKVLSKRLDNDDRQLVKPDPSHTKVDNISSKTQMTGKTEIQVSSLAKDILDALNVEDGLSYEEIRALQAKIKSAPTEELVQGLRLFFDDENDTKKNHNSRVMAGYYRSTLISTMLTTISEKDPESAIDLIDSGYLKKYYSAYGDILNGWSKKAPEDALEYYMNHQGKVHTGAVTRVFANYAEIDYNKALDVLLEKNNRFSHGENLASAKRIGKKIKSSEELLLAVKGLNVDSNISAGLLSGWAEVNFEDSKQLLNEITNESQKKYLYEGLLKGLFRKDFNTAMNWYYDSNDNDSLTKMTEELLKLQSFELSYNSRGLQKWLDGSQHEKSQEIIKPIVEHYIDRNNNRAHEFLKYVADVNDRLKFSVKIYEKLRKKKNKPQHLKKFLDSSEFSEEELKKETSF